MRCKQIWYFHVIAIKFNLYLSSFSIKNQISEGDSLPKFVCQMCWKITESFHKLYQRSKVAQDTFLNTIIKSETDPYDCSCNDEHPFGDDIKLEAFGKHL